MSRPRCTTASRAGPPSGSGRGSALSDVLDRCRPLPGARYLVFHSYQFHEESGDRYYECIDFVQARLPQTILAYEMNGVPLPVAHGAPLRLRVEPKLGFKMVKFLRSIEVVADYRDVGEGMGGVREDHQQFDMGAEIWHPHRAVRPEEVHMSGTNEASRDRERWTDDGLYTNVVCDLPPPRGGSDHGQDAGPDRLGDRARRPRFRLDRSHRHSPR